MPHEARAMPGGATGLYLFLLGGAAVFLAGAIALLSGFGAAGFGEAGWMIPAWGACAVVLAVILRKRRGALLSVASRLWLGIGIAGLALVIFGTSVRWA